MVTLRSSKHTTLSATEEFWHSPISSEMPPTSDKECSQGQGGDEHAAIELPPAHHQLLVTDEPAAYESLKGYDHTRGAAKRTATNSVDEPSFCCKQKLSVIKQQGGGSWLLGFARLNEKPVVEDEDEEDLNPPGLVEEDTSSDSEDDDASATSSDEASAAISKPPTRRRRGVVFAESVTVQPVPHSSELSPLQRRRMYSTSYEVRQNKIRNKKEFRFDGYDWRNVTEEWEMGVDMVTGELVHPAREQQYNRRA